MLQQPNDPHDVAVSQSLFPPCPLEPHHCKSWKAHLSRHPSNYEHGNPQSLHLWDRWALRISVFAQRANPDGTPAAANDEFRPQLSQCRWYGCRHSRSQTIVFFLDSWNPWWLQLVVHLDHGIAGAKLTWTSLDARCARRSRWKDFARSKHSIWPRT